MYIRVVFLALVAVVIIQQASCARKRSALSNLKQDLDINIKTPSLGLPSVDIKKLINKIKYYNPPLNTLRWKLLKYIRKLIHEFKVKLNKLLNKFGYYKD